MTKTVELMLAAWIVLVVAACKDTPVSHDAAIDTPAACIAAGETCKQGADPACCGGTTCGMHDLTSAYCCADLGTSCTDAPCCAPNSNACFGGTCGRCAPAGYNATCTGEVYIPCCDGGCRSPC